MTFVRKSLPSLLALFASIAALSLDAFAVDRDKNKFSPPELDSLETKLTISDVTVAAVPYDQESLASAAFGKLDPYEHGVLPVLVMIRNGSKGAVKLDNMKVEYHDRDRRSVDATPASDVPYLNAPKRPTFGGPQIPGVTTGKRRIRSPRRRSRLVPSPPRCSRPASLPMGSSISVPATGPARRYTLPVCRKLQPVRICSTSKFR